MAISDILSSFSSAATQLTGYGGKQLSDQVAGETEEERKKRLRLLQQQGGSGAALGSMAVSQLFGSTGAYGR